MFAAGPIRRMSRAVRVSVSRWPVLGRIGRRALPHPVQRRIQATRARAERLGFEPRVVEHVYSGVRLRLQLSNKLGEWWYDKDWPELPELPLLQGSRLRPGARAFDIGAHQGVVALLLADAVGPEGAVLAVEAERHDADIARRNCELNDARNVEVLHAAAGETSGTVRFGADGEVAPEDSGPGGVEVAAYSIDDLAARHGAPDVVYVDVEGYECNVLRGARATLASPADWHVEVHDPPQLAQFGTSASEVLAHFPADAYRRWVAIPGDDAFHPLAADGDAPPKRFHLLALAREAAG